MWSSNLSSASSCFPCFSRTRFFRVQVVQSPGPGHRGRQRNVLLIPLCQKPSLVLFENLYSFLHACFKNIQQKTFLFNKRNHIILIEGLYLNAPQEKHAFSTNVPLLDPRFSDVFRGYRGGTLVENGLVTFHVQEKLLLL